MLTHVVTGQAREAKPAGSYVVAPAPQAHPNAPTQVKPCEAGASSAPVARPLMEVRCAWCKRLMRYVRCTPELDGACSHGACRDCAAKFRAGVL